MLRLRVRVYMIKLKVLCHSAPDTLPAKQRYTARPTVSYPLTLIFTLLLRRCHRHGTILYEPPNLDG